MTSSRSLRSVLVRGTNPRSSRTTSWRFLFYRFLSERLHGRRIFKNHLFRHFSLRISRVFIPRKSSYPEKRMNLTSMIIPTMIVINKTHIESVDSLFLSIICIPLPVFATCFNTACCFFTPFIFSFGEHFRKVFGQPSSHQLMVSTSMNSHFLWMMLPSPEETVLRKRYLTSFSFSNSEDSLE